MINSKRINPRLQAALAVEQVIGQQRSLAEVLPQALEQTPTRQVSFVHELTAGTLRWWWRLTAAIDGKMQKPLKAKDFDVYCLLAVGVYQLGHTRVPEHAAVSETVNAAVVLGKPWSGKLINAILRNCLRDGRDSIQKLQQSPSVEFSHPEWMLQRYQQDWPQHWQSIAQGNNKPPSLTIRVNPRQMSRRQVLEMLSALNIDAEQTKSSPDGVIIKDGSKIWQTELWLKAKLNVQDESAQLVSHAVPLKPGMKVLDACAAPGGKTAHLLEIEPAIELLALDKQPQRMRRLEQNLKRLDLSCDTKIVDASELDSWWQGEAFDLIVIDAPCSGSGVIRKHPDIKHLRRPQDIVQNVKTQRRLLDKLWSVLKDGGHMLYCTCSVFRQENDRQAEWLLTQKANAGQCPLPVQYGLKLEYGRQRLPGDDESDGFYYACFEKRPS